MLGGFDSHALPPFLEIPIMNAFRIIAFLEGVSYLLLLGVAVPVKYLMSDPSYVKMLGMPHGILFVVYVLMALIFKRHQEWTIRQLGIVLLCSILPVGTFYSDKKYLR